MKDLKYLAALTIPVAAIISIYYKGVWVFFTSVKSNVLTTARVASGKNTGKASLPPLYLKCFFLMNLIVPKLYAHIPL